MKYNSIGPPNWAKVTFDVGRQTLKDWRDSGARRSEETIEIWENVLKGNAAKLGDEQWVVYEQICFAAIDCFDIPLVNKCIKELSERFPKSSRVLKLKAMQYEAEGRYDAAMHIYNGLIESDPTNNGYRKRRIALLVAQSKRLEAIKELNDYLSIFLNDSEGWLQLSELFLAENDLGKAVHCLEECILISPLNTLFLRRLGDLRYSQGGQDNIELAKAYYEQAVKLNPSDLRALYGIVLCSNYLGHHMKGTSDKKKEFISAGTLATEKIISRYQEAEKNETNPEMSSLLSSVEQMKTAFASLKQ